MITREQLSWNRKHGHGCQWIMMAMQAEERMQQRGLACKDRRIAVTPDGMETSISTPRTVRKGHQEQSGNDKCNVGIAR
jgi:hypothetical protein